MIKKIIYLVSLVFVFANPVYAHDLVGKYGADFSLNVYAGQGYAKPIKSFADYGDDTNVTVTSTAHGKSNGDFVIIVGSDFYNGSYQIANVATDTFTITATWEANDRDASWLDAYSFSGHTAELKIWDAPAGSEIEDADATVEGTGAGGWISAELTDTEVDALTIGKYYYDLIDIHADGQRDVLFSGDFFVKGYGATDKTVTDVVLSVDSNPDVVVTLVGGRGPTGPAGGAAEDTAYGVDWNNDLDSASKNSIYDKIETLGGSGTMTTVKENDVGVGGADIATLDFLGADFDLAESPDTEVQVIIAAAIARDTEIDADITTHAGVADAHGSWEPAGITESDISDLSHFDADPDSLTGDTVDDNKVDAAIIADLSGTYEPAGITESDISDLTHTTDTGPSPDCTGTTTYQDGEGNCDDISSVYEPAGITESDISDLTHDGTGTDDQTAAEVSVDTSAFGVNFSNDASHDTAQELFDIVDDLSLGGGSGDVTAASTLTDNAIVTGDGGVKGVQDSAVTIDDNGLVTVPTGATAGLFFGDGDTGIFENVDDTIAFKIGGGTYYDFKNYGILFASTNSPQILTTNATSTVPVYVFRNDANTGVGWAGADMLSLIAGGSELMRLDANAASDSVKITAPTSTSVGLNIEAASGQSVDLIQCTSNAGTPGDLCNVDETGLPTFAALANCDTIDTDANGVFSCGSDDGGGGGGSMTTIKENDVQVGGADIVTLDFLGADFDLAESPDTEIQVVVNADITRDVEWDTLAEINAASTDTDAVLDTDIGSTVQAYSANMDTDSTDDATAASTLTDNAIIRGDGGVKGVQDSAVTIDDNGLITVPTGSSAGMKLGDVELFESASNILDIDSGGNTAVNIIAVPSGYPKLAFYHGANFKGRLQWHNANGRFQIEVPDDEISFITNSSSELMRLDGNAGSDTVKITAPTSTSVGLNIEAAAASSVDLFQLTSNGGTPGDRFKVDENGNTTATTLTVSPAGYIVTDTIYSQSNNNTMNLQPRSFTAADVGVNVSYGTWTNSSGLANPFLINPKYNQTSTASATDLLINRTETAIGSGAQLFADFQVGGTSRFNWDNVGTMTIAPQATPTTDADGEIAFDTDGWGTGFDALELYNGTASAYVVATTATDTPTDQQVPTWNTGGEITWEDGGGAETNSLETLTTGILADEIPMGTNTDTVTYKAMPSTGTNGCSGSGDKLLYNTTTDTWSCGADAGAGGGMTSFTVQADDTNTMTVTDGETVDIAGGLGLTTTAATGSPEQLTVDYDHSLTLAGNPALAVDECVPVATLGGGGMICEGSTANTNEQLYLFPDLDGADTTQEITLNDATQTLTNKTIDATNTVTINASDITDLNGSTDITADLEEETHAAEHANGGGDAVDHDTLTNFASNEHFTQASITTVGTIATGTWEGTTVAVDQGGTGATTLTDGGILLGSGTGAITALGAATNGQIPIGDGTTDPVLATITGGRSTTVTNGAGTITIASDEETYAFTAKIAFEDPTATDDFFFHEMARAATITSIYCKTLVGTVDLDVTVAAADINGTDITCNTTGVLDSSLAGDTTAANGDELKLAITSVATSPTYIMVQINGTFDD